MKCVCGYEQGMDWVGEDPSEEKYIEVNPDGDKFRKIKGHYVVESNDSWTDGSQVNLYACPECGTVRMQET